MRDCDWQDTGIILIRNADFTRLHVKKTDIGLGHQVAPQTEPNISIRLMGNSMLLRFLVYHSFASCAVRQIGRKWFHLVDGITNRIWRHQKVAGHRSSASVILNIRVCPSPFTSYNVLIRDRTWFLPLGGFKTRIQHHYLESGYRFFSY